MPPEVLIVRFPDGSREFRYPTKTKVFEVDDVIWHDDARYRVVSVSIDGDSTPAVAIVELDSPSLGDKLQSEEGGIRLAPVRD